MPISFKRNAPYLFATLPVMCATATLYIVATKPPPWVGELVIIILLYTSIKIIDEVIMVIRSTYSKQPGDGVKIIIIRMFYLYTMTIISFAISYDLIQASFIKEAFLTSTKEKFEIFNAIYFSSTTIETVGFGDIVPAIWQSKLCVLAEIFMGLVFKVFIFSVIGSLIIEKRSS